MDVSAVASPGDVNVAKRRQSGDDSLAEWQGKNPLRVWRESQPPEGWSRAVLARQLEVSHTAVASWEDGKRLPMVDAVAKIERLTGIGATKWMEWYEQRPQEDRK